MLKQEFLDGLRRALAGKVEVEVIDETVRYYEDYIDVQIKKGASEDYVMEQLGKPQLIAKSIVIANNNGKESGDTESSSGIYEEGEGRYSRTKMGDKGVKFIANMPQWLAIFLAVFIFILIIWFVGSVLSFFAPVLIPAGIVFIIVALVKRRQ